MRVRNLNPAQKWEIVIASAWAEARTAMSKTTKWRVWRALMQLPSSRCFSATRPTPLCSAHSRESGRSRGHA